MSTYIVVDKGDFVSRSCVSPKPFVYYDLNAAINACNSSECVLKVEVHENK